MLQAIGDDIWVVDHDFFNFGIHFPGRMTVIRLKSGGLWLHSPVPIDDELAAQLAELGPVEHLVGPNLFHHVHELSGDSESERPAPAAPHPLPHIAVSNNR